MAGGIAEVPRITEYGAGGGIGEGGRQRRDASAGACGEAGRGRRGACRNGLGGRAAAACVSDRELHGIGARRIVGFGDTLSRAGGAVAQIPGAAGDRASRGVFQGDQQRRGSRDRSGAHAGDRSGGYRRRHRNGLGRGGAAARTGGVERDRIGAGGRVGLGGILSGAGGTVAKVPGAAGNVTRRAVSEVDRHRRGARCFIRCEARARGCNGECLGDFIGKSTFDASAIVGLHCKVIRGAIAEIVYGCRGRGTGVGVDRIGFAGGAVVNAIARRRAAAGVPGQTGLTGEDVSCDQKQS